MENAAYKDEPDYEIINGTRAIMSRPTINHITTIVRLVAKFGNYIDEHDIEGIVLSGANVYLSEAEQYRSDLSIICDLSMVKNGKRVYGAPNMVVEVLSLSTMDNDLGPKKKAYEECGVKEYWIVDQWSKRIEVYHLVEGRYVFAGSYKVSDDEEGGKTEIKISIFEDCVVDIRDVFKWWIP